MPGLGLGIGLEATIFSLGLEPCGVVNVTTNWVSWEQLRPEMILVQKSP